MKNDVHDPLLDRLRKRYFAVLEQLKLHIRIWRVLVEMAEGAVNAVL